jgi:hypothetical protein
MGTHPVNLLVRFLLELSALFVLGLWGWHRRDDGLRILIALTIPLIAAALWGTFAVPNDPTRSGSAPVPVSGLLRLALELGFFGCATLALYDLRFITCFHTTASGGSLDSRDRIDGRTATSPDRAVGGTGTA